MFSRKFYFSSKFRIRYLISLFSDPVNYDPKLGQFLSISHFVIFSCFLFFLVQISKEISTSQPLSAPSEPSRLETLLPARSNEEDDFYDDEGEYYDEENDRTTLSTTPADPFTSAEVIQTSSRYVVLYYIHKINHIKV